STASMPFLSMVRSAAAETRSFTQRFSLATQNRRSCRLGMKRRRVLFIACDTLLPVVVRLPVTWQTRDIAHLGFVMVPPLARKAAAPAGTAQRPCLPRVAGQARWCGGGRKVACPAAPGPEHEGSGRSEPGIMPAARPVDKSPAGTAARHGAGGWPGSGA